ncbi:MAG: DNA-directed RNA polymerase subunit B [Candidatus Woesearchaeota archaeon]|jgi:DNA-directed RNA polymerase subunit B'|nr:DNA-directed RNA polymerase subunit B [Candidatus Woesearchaeota archaeon]MDP7458049.1 DNA-directed RNA polymerase subunit B [Candidatus Woesearchaeota archaeon]
MTEIYLRGKFIGTVDNADDFVKQIKQERRKGVISKNLNVYLDKANDEVHVDAAGGRARRPLIIVKDGIPLLTEKHIKQLESNEITWSDLVDQGIIEYLDAAEEENALISFDAKQLTPENTHMEITPTAMLGLTTSLVPFGNFNPSARLNAGSKNQKQALGFYASNFSVRLDMDVNILHYPQVPVVKTMMHDISSYEKHPAGQNVIVAVMSYKGYNMEDAIVLNQGSIDRGLGRSSYYRPSVAEELRYSGGLMDSITIPDKDIKGYKSEKDYRLLEGDGIIFPEAKVNEDDVIIGKTSPPRFLSGLDEYNLASSTRRESSVSLRHGEKGVVDFILITENEEGNKLVQVRIRDQRIPEIGDKFTSRHGQKGIIGMIVPHSDMPFTSTGVVPDILFSPHSIPSRMTVAHLLELVAGKTGSLAGRPINGTTFDSEAEDAIREELLSLGFREDGSETMFDGATGQKYGAKIYIGNMYYMKLKHMVANKLHSRARGPIQLLTRQPTEGRAKEGGLRLGEMEKDTFVAHGASLLLKERFDSDKTVIPVSEETGLMGFYDGYHDKRLEPVSSENADVNDIEISYAFKLMLDEFKSLGLYPKLILKNKY